MALKNLLLLVFLTALLFFFLDVAHARELSEASESEGKNVKPSGMPGVEDQKWGGGYHHGGGYGYGGGEVVTVVAVAMVVVEATEEDKVVVGLDK
uniref:Glycine-rich protein n=1 Tax=Oryza rufipogon TaxID=4529 RepID=A0A0E0PX12_ORYRU